MYGMIVLHWLVLVWHVLWAATAPADGQRPRGQEVVVVTATREDLAARRLVLPVRVLTLRDLELAPGATLDARLQQIAGFATYRRMTSLVAHPTTQGLALRGLRTNATSRTLVLLDGVPLNDPFGGWIQWQRVPQSMLTQVEWYPGPMSALWGNYGLAGVVQLVTRGGGRPRFQGWLAGGGLGTLEADFSLRHVRGAGTYHLGWRYFRTRGYIPVDPAQRGPVDRHAGLHALAFLWNAHWALGPRAGLELQLHGFLEDRSGGTALTENATRLGWLRVGTEIEVTSRDTLRVSVTGQIQRFRSFFAAVAPDRSAERPALHQFRVPARTIRFQLEWRRVLGPHREALLGMDLERVSGFTHEDYRWTDSAFTRRRRAGGATESLGVFARYRVQVHPHMRVAAGLRLDGWRTFAGQRRVWDLPTGRLLQAVRFPARGHWVLSPELAFRWAPAPALTVHVQLARSFRAPTLNELYRPFRVGPVITQANAALRPERLDSVETGMAYRWPGRGHLRVQGFFKHMDHPVANVEWARGPGNLPPCGFVPVGGVCRQRQNLAALRVVGLDVAGTWRVRPGLRLDLRYVYQRARIQDPGPLQGRRPAQVPEHTLLVQTNWTPTAAVTVTVRLRYESGRFEDNANRRFLSGGYLVDLTYVHQVRPGVGLFLSVENLFNRRWEAGLTPDGVYRLGTPRLVQAGVRFRFL